MRRLAWLLVFLPAVASAQNTYPPLVRVVPFASLSSAANNGTINYCSDCDTTDPCAGGGSGAFAFRVNGAWNCAVSGAVGAPTGAEYVVSAAHAGLSAERVCTDTVTIDCDAGTAGQMKFNWLGATFTAPTLGPVGCAAPGYSFTGHTTSGMCYTATDEILIQTEVTPGVNAPFLQIDADTGASMGSYTAGGVTYNGFEATPTVNRIWWDSLPIMTADGTSFTFGTTAHDLFALDLTAKGAGQFTGHLAYADLAAARTWTLPDVSGTPQVNLVAGTAAPGATECDAANEVGRLYHQSGDPATINLQLFRCVQTGPASYAWHPADHYAGTACPATCTAAAGGLCYDTDDDVLKSCSANDTWTAIGTGMTDPGSNGILARTALNTVAARTLALGEGLSGSNLDGVAGNPTFGADRATVVFKGAGAADPPAACGDTGDPFQLQDHYLETDTSEDSVCIAIDTWALVGHIADDKVIVGTGTGAVVETIPDCDDTGGNHLNYNTTGSAGSRISCGTSGGAAAFDSATTTDYIEEFLTGSYETGEIGALGWEYLAINSGGIDVQASYYGAAITGHPGIVQMKSHATNDNSGLILMMVGAGTKGWLAANGTWELDFLFMSEHDTNIQFMVGMMSANITTRSGSNAGIWARFDTDASDATAIFQMCAASGANGCGATGDDTDSEVVASTVTPVGGTFYRLRISRTTSPVTYSFRINDETAKTFCASSCDDDLGGEPGNTVEMLPAFHFLTRTTTEVRYFIPDMARLQITGQSRY